MPTDSIVKQGNALDWSNPTLWTGLVVVLAVAGLVAVVRNLPWSRPERRLEIKVPPQATVEPPPAMNVTLFPGEASSAVAQALPKQATSIF
jgi:hypothetical protein